MRRMQFSETNVKYTKMPRDKDEFVDIQVCIDRKLLSFIFVTVSCVHITLNLYFMCANVAIIGTRNAETAGYICRHT